MAPFPDLMDRNAGEQWEPRGTPQPPLLKELGLGDLGPGLGKGRRRRRQDKARGKADPSSSGICAPSMGVQRLPELSGKAHEHCGRQESPPGSCK